MPVNRKMLAADSKLAQQLSQIAQKNNTSLYSLTNRIIESFLYLERAGYKDPLDATLDFLVLDSIVRTGFRVYPPKINGSKAWENIGETIWYILRDRTPNMDIAQAIVRLAGILLDKRHVLIDTEKGTSILITVPSDSPFSTEDVFHLFKGIIYSDGEAKNRSISKKANVIMIRIE